MYRTGYDTLIGSAIKRSHIEHALRQAFVQNYHYAHTLNVVTTLDYGPVFITGQSSYESSIPLFGHPLMVEMNGNHFLCVDVRQYVKQSNDYSQELEIRNRAEFNFTKERFLMNLAWITGSLGRMALNLRGAGPVFAAWISSSVSRRYALDPAEQMRLYVIAFYYYTMLFTDEPVMSEERKEKLAIYIEKTGRCPKNIIQEVFAKIDQLGEAEWGLPQLVKLIKSILENIRLEDFSDGALITVIGNTWFSPTGKELLAIALEHPPTWLAIVNSALNERTYRNSQIAKLAADYLKGNDAKDFTTQYQDLIALHINPEDHSSGSKVEIARALESLGELKF